MDINWVWKLNGFVVAEAGAPAGSASTELASSAMVKEKVGVGGRRCVEGCNEDVGVRVAPGRLGGGVVAPKRLLLVTSGGSFQLRLSSESSGITIEGGLLLRVLSAVVVASTLRPGAMEWNEE